MYGLTMGFKKYDVAKVTCFSEKAMECYETKYDYWLCLSLFKTHMPQIAKGGKFVFGWSEISPGLQVRIPPQTYREYNLKGLDRVIIISGSKTSGGLCVTTKSLLEGSVMGQLFCEHPQLADYQTKVGDLLKYKGRLYGWVSMNGEVVQLTDNVLKKLGLKIGDRLLSIRGSNIAFVMAVKGPKIEAANKTELHIPVFFP